MLSQDVLLRKVRNLLGEFLLPMLAVADRPRQKFLRQALRGILLSGSLVVTEFSRWIHDHCSDRFYRIKRLLNHLTSAGGDLVPMIQAYRQSIAKRIGVDTPLIIDTTDLAKPRARKMKYLAYVMDGSEQKLVPGYWCVEVYAHLSNKRLLPLALDAFSVDDPTVGSMNLQIIRTVTAIHQGIGARGVYVADRGFDGLEMYEMWFSLNCHFVVRQRGDRMIVTLDGVRIRQRDLIEQLQHVQATTGGQTNIVFTQGYLPNKSQPLYMVASWLPGIEEPLILLTTLLVQNLQQARRVLGYYQQRWSCEQANGFLKSRVGLERFRIRRYDAIQRLVILAMFAMAFLTWLLLRSHVVTHNLYLHTSRFRKHATFAYYRLLDGLQTLVNLHPPPNLQKLLLQPSKNG